MRFKTRSNSINFTFHTKVFLEWGNAEKGEVAHAGRSISHEDTKTRRFFREDKAKGREVVRFSASSAANSGILCVRSILLADGDVSVPGKKTCRRGRRRSQGYSRSLGKLIIKNSLRPWRPLREIAGARGYANLRMTRVALWPPNPKELERMVSTFAWRAVWGI